MYSLMSMGSGANEQSMYSLMSMGSDEHNYINSFIVNSLSYLQNGKEWLSTD
jgi:hypothetical protein